MYWGYFLVQFTPQPQKSVAGRLGCGFVPIILINATIKTNYISLATVASLTDCYNYLKEFMWEHLRVYSLGSFKQNTAGAHLHAASANLYVIGPVFAELALHVFSW